MKLYVYCVTETIESLPEKLKGIAGAEVRLFQTESFSLLVSDFSGDVVQVYRENALVHAAV
ncbi:MAG TPA: GvpL/GvpF family gas vesicle protein, partial [Pyrinomonadaceae bacterium]